MDSSAAQARADNRYRTVVVGDTGLHTIAGRLLGSVPGIVSRRAQTDVLIVHTTGNGPGHR